MGKILVKDIKTSLEEEVSREDILFLQARVLYLDLNPGHPVLFHPEATHTSYPFNTLAYDWLKREEAEDAGN